MSLIRFTADDVHRLLDRLPLSVPGAILIALVSFARSRSLVGPSLRLQDHIRAHRYLSLLLGYVAVKTVHRALTRLTRNGGWRADPPKWSFEKGEGDIVLITGGSTGIGKEIVELLAKKTDKIAVLDLAPPTYAASGVKHFTCDITDPKAVAEVAKRVKEEVGNPTILINNAGIIRGKTLLETTPEEHLLTYKVNVLGAHNVLREFLPHIIRINHGHIMTTASSAAYYSLPQLGAYCCSKAAALSLHETLVEELKHRYNAANVRTSVICPTKVGTSLGTALADTKNQFLTPTLSPKFLAGEMVRIVESGLSDHLTAPLGPAVFLPSLRSAPEYYRWVVNKLENTSNTVTDARNAAETKDYTIVKQLDKQHGLE
ncbi:hypothetical protein JCM6882_004682 [Rhodosporidiobolus microsporus]